MAFNFPDSPTIGQLAFGYIWDGTAWQANSNNPVGPAVARMDALAYNGMQVNGSMDVSQELGYGSNRATVGWLCDGWYQYFTGTMALVGGSGTATAPGFRYNLYVVVTTAQASLGANDQVIVLQKIEGFRVARLAWGTASAQPITIGFWSKHARTGIYSVAVANGTGRCYVATYTHNVANVFQYNTVTIPGDTTGSWATDNTVGLQITFAMAAGTTLTAPAANTWYGTNYSAAPGQVNGVASTSDVFVITGVVVLPGIEAPTAAQSPLIMRPYDQELLTCQRYWCNGYYSWNGYGQGYVSHCVYFPVWMRSAPAVTAANQAISGGGNATPNIQYINQKTCEIYHVVGAPGVMTCIDTWKADARL